MKAATPVVSSGGYEEMSIRSLASDLGSPPCRSTGMSLTRTTFSQAVVDRILANAWKAAVS